MKLNLKSMALSGGILLAAIALIGGVWFQITGYAADAVKMVSAIYGNLVQFGADGQSFAHPLSSIALLTAFTFVDGAILGIVFALFYNMFLPKESKTNKE